MENKEAIAIEAFQKAHAKYFLGELVSLGYGPTKEIKYQSKLHTSWTELSCSSLLLNIQVSVVLFTSALWGKLDGSIVTSIVRNPANHSSDDYLNFKMFLQAHGLADPTWSFPMEGACDEEIREGCDRVMKNCAELLFIHGRELLTGEVWEPGHYERKD